MEHDNVETARVLSLDGSGFRGIIAAFVLKRLEGLTGRPTGGWGLAGWARPLLGLVLDGVADAVDYQLRRLCIDPEAGVESYYRFQTELAEGAMTWTT